MGQYSAACICLNGHLSSGDASSSDATPRCLECGEHTISRCPACKCDIRGKFLSDLGFARKASVKSYCHNCGESYPWTDRKADAVFELADAIEELTQVERDSLRELLPHMINETPRTPAAGFKILAIVQRAGPAARGLLKEAIVSVAVDAGKKAMGL